MNIITNYLQTKEEFHKVIFPIKEQIRGAYIAVFIVVTVIAIFLAIVDAFMGFAVSSALN
jgi:preprotein translocase subunit SecE